MSTHTKLTRKERELIDVWKEEGVSNKEIGRRLMRHPSTIGRELNTKSYHIGIYDAQYAQKQTDMNKRKAWGAKHPLKNKVLYEYIMEKLRDAWSPEQIAGRLRREYPQDSTWHISHEAIYQYIYSQQTKDQGLWEYLRRKQKRRCKKYGRKSQRVRIPDRVSIHDRPAVVDERQEFGHWEGDSLVGKGRANGLHTAYERVSSMIRFEKMNRMSAVESASAQQRIYAPLPQGARRSTTLDNGSEHVNHKVLKTLIDTYFADPYAAYQRGGNENANLWIRYYYPKGTDFAPISNQELKEVEAELNNRPRKRLGFQSPLEVFTEYLTKGCDRS